MERCSTPRRGLEAPDPIDLIFKEKWGFGGIATKRVRAVARTDPTNYRVLWLTADGQLEIVCANTASCFSQKQYPGKTRDLGAVFASDGGGTMIRSSTTFVFFRDIHDSPLPLSRGCRG
ncbi:hypothetical protein GCM10027396_17780 [Insolitispirillum peregrinum]